MATTTSFSSSTSLHSFLTPRTSLHGSSNVDFNQSQNQVARTNVSFWRSSASYVRVDCGLNKFCGKPIVKQLQKRAGIIWSATVEEIEAEKSMIEKDVKQRMEKTIETLRANFNSVRTDRASPSMLDRVDELSKVVAKLSEEGKVALRNIRRDALKAYDKLEKEKKLSEDNVKDFSADLEKMIDEYMKKVETISKQNDQESSIDIKLPRRSLLVQFTCKSCGERTKRLINRVAYERGTVFVQCSGCLQYHKLVDNLGLVVEYDFRNDTGEDQNADAVYL